MVVTINVTWCYWSIVGDHKVWKYNSSQIAKKRLCSPSLLPGLTERPHVRMNNLNILHAKIIIIIVIILEGYHCYLTYYDIPWMCCSTEPQSGVRMRPCMIYGIYIIHSRVLQSRHDTADHTYAHVKLIQSCLWFELNQDSLENQDVLLTSSDCLLVCYPSTLLVEPLWFLQQKSSLIIRDNDICYRKQNLAKLTPVSNIFLLQVRSVPKPLFKQCWFSIIPNRTRWLEELKNLPEHC